MRFNLLSGKLFAALLMVFALCLSASPSAALDNPHNKVINCDTCHQTPSGSWWTDQGASGGLCGQCHYPASPNRDAVTHQALLCTYCHNPHYQKQFRTWKQSSYLATGTISTADSATLTRAGTSPAWFVDQWKGMLLIPNVRYIQYNYRILSNTNTTITIDASAGDAINTSNAVAGSAFAVTYGRLIKEAMNGKSVRFFGDTGDNSFADADATVDGVCQVCHAKTASFTAAGVLEGPGHPGKQAGKDCTECHSHTSSDGGFVAACNACHGVPPVDTVTLVGFTNPSSTGSTTAGAHEKHVNIMGIDCASCHYQSVGSGATHNDLPTPPQTVSIGFSLFGGIHTGGSYDGQTSVAYDTSEASTTVSANGQRACSNIYCHGKFNGSGLNATPQWNNLAAAPCGSCHGASNTTVPNSGGHMIHADVNVHNYSCTLCHRNVVGGSGPNGYSIADQGNHVNGMVDWQFDTADPRVSASSSYSIASGSKVPSNGTTPRVYGTCSMSYCHSIAQTSTGGALTGAAGEYTTTPKWGPGSGSYFCGACHKNGSAHNYGSPAPMDSGSHTRHLAYRFNTLANSNGASMKCSICHKYDASGAFNTCDSCHGMTSSAALYSGHVNGTVNVAFEPVFGAATYNDTNTTTGAPGNGFFSCSNTYCHSNGTSVSTGTVPANTAAQWGATGPLPCDSCHGAGGDGSGRPDYATTAPKANSHQSQKHVLLSCNKCHYSTTTMGTTIASTTTHVNKSYDVNGDGTLLSSFTYAYNTNGGACSNGYCHSKGTSLATGTIEPNTTPSWGEVAFPMACSQWTGQSCITAGCHQFGYIYVPVPPSTYSYKSCSVCHGSNTPGTLTKGSYPSNPHKCYGCHRFQPINAPDAPKANSHYTHTFSFPCNYCHYSTTTDGTTITNTANHVNGSYDVVPDPNGLYGGGNVNFTYAFDPGGGKCTNINCHITRGIGSWQSWGGVWVNVSSAWKSGPSCYEMIFYNVSASGGTPPYTYLWDFGDGTTSTEQNPTHVFPTGATYTVTVTARDANRHPGTKTAPITPQPVNTAPVADMELSVYGWTVTLTDKSYDTDYNTCGHSGPGTIEIMWGDGTRTNETIALTDVPINRTYTHTYTAANSNMSHFDLIRDNVGVQSQKYIGVAVPTTYTISGRVANAAGVGLNGAVIYLRTMSGAVPPIGIAGLFTDVNGNYTFTGTAVDGECYLVKQPVKLGYTFTPAGDQTVCAASSSVNWTSSP